MQNLALVTCLFDYPNNINPLFYNNALKYFNAKDIYIIRYNEQHKDWSLYQKLYYYKIVKNIEYYKLELQNKYEYLIFADATDTNIYRSIDSSIIDIFHTFNSDIVFCGEKCAWPPIDSQYSYNNKPKLSDKFYLNSGLYMGYTNKVIQHMKNIISNNRTPYDDQGHWTIEYLLNNNICVDQNNLLFFSSLNCRNNVHIKDNEFPVLDCNPYFVHDNGPHNNETIKIANLL